MEQKEVRQKIEYRFSTQTIPYAVLEFAVRHKKFTSVQVFVLIKFGYKHKFFDKDVKEIASILGQTVKTVRKHIAWLVEAGWLTHNVGEGIFHTRSWEFIRLKLNDFRRSGYIFYMKRLDSFKAFAIASTFDHLIRLQRYKKWKRDWESAKKGRSQQTSPNSKGYYPVANIAYGEIFGLSESTSSRYRELARKAKYIQTKEQFEELAIPTNNRIIVEIFKEEFNRYPVYRKKAYYLQGITLIRANLDWKKVRKLTGKFCNH